jgi:hypothetical protein
MVGETTGHARNARADREVRKADFARLLSRLLDQHAVTRAEVAAAVGVSPQHVQQWADPEGAKHLSVPDAEAVPCEALRVAIAERIVGPTCVVVLVPTSDEAHRGLDLKAAAGLARAASEATVPTLEALGDGVIDPAERRELAPRLREAARRFLEAALALEADERAHIEALRPRGLRSVR